MTNALCLACGGIKFGALNPCPACGSGSTGNMNLDILFGDHHFHLRTLEQFGAVIKTIQQAPAEAAVQHRAFLLYISDYHPSVMQVSPRANWVLPVRAFLNTLTLPTVELLGRNGLPAPEARRAEHSRRKPWWQFWKRGP